MAHATEHLIVAAADGDSVAWRLRATCAGPVPGLVRRIASADTMYTDEGIMGNPHQQCG